MSHWHGFQVALFGKLVKCYTIVERLEEGSRAGTRETRVRHDFSRDSNNSVITIKAGAEEGMSACEHHGFS